MDSLTGPVPEGWNQIRLREICSILSGPSGTRLHVASRTPDRVPIVTPHNLRNNRITGHIDIAVNAEQAASLSRYRIRPMDIVVARTGVLGRQGLASPQQDGWLLGSGCLRLRPDSRLNPRYLTYYLDHPSVHEWIVRNGVASAIPTLTAATLGALPVVMPPTDTQIAIAETLSAFDEKVIVHEQIAETTAALREAVTPLLFAPGRDSSAR